MVRLSVVSFSDNKVFLFARIGDSYSRVIDRVVCIIQNKQ